ncbi:MAG: HEPN domain-containing protein [Actinomycetota bacterium]|nr:HEPN domain-containing protein [Actinomycetota bacterium]
MSRDLAKEARRWLAQASEDLDVADLLVDHGRYAHACFLAQQSAEKTLKAFLYARGAELVIGHSVADLCAEVARQAPDLAGRCADWATLDQFYIPTRYPDALPGDIPSRVYGPEQASAALSRTRDVLEEVSVRIDSDPAG